MTETTRSANGRSDAKKARRPAGLSIERVFTSGVHPYDEVTWERRDVVQTNWKTGAVVFEQKGVEFPDFWSVNASTIVTTKYFRGALGTSAREHGLKQLIDRVVRTYRKAGEDFGYFATEADARDLRARADLDAAAPVLLVQLPGVVQRRHGLPAAGQRLLHPLGRRLDGLDPQLVPRGGLHLQGRLGRRPQPLPDPLVQGAAQLRRHGLGPGLLHARRRCQRGHDQVRRRHPAGGQDGRARCRPPRHRGVHRDQGQARRTRSARCGTRASTWTSAARTSPRSSTRTPTTPSGSPTSSCAPSRTESPSGCGRARTIG